MLIEEGLVENAATLEKVVWRELAGLDRSIVHTVRGRGLFFAIVITPTEGNEKGNTHTHTLPSLPLQGSRHGMCVRG